MIGREDEVREYRDRAFAAYWVVLVALGCLLLRLFFLQVYRGEELKRFSEANRLKKERLFPTRGVIYDRNGRVIVDNRAAFDVVMLAQYYGATPERNQRLAGALKLPVLDLEKKIKKGRRGATFYPTLLRADVDKDAIAAIEMEAEGFPGVDIEASVMRRYPLGEFGSQLLGYIGELNKKEVAKYADKNLEQGDFIGRMGIERAYDEFLRGENGVGYVEVDAMGRRRKPDNNERLLGFVSQTEPVPGDNLYLTLDVDLQEAAGKAMKSREFNGTVVAMDPRNGEVLAMVSLPSYQPTEISGREINVKAWNELRENKERPLRNRAIQDHYPPGSTFKPIVALAGLAEGLITTKTSVTCHGHLQFGSRRFHCWRRHGTVDFYKSIRESCDVFYYQLANQLGIDRLAKWARAFGFGAMTGIALGNEQTGLMPDSEWKKKRFNDVWRPGETLSVAIGQGAVDATPIQLVSAYSAIANGGFLYRPLIVRRIERRTGETLRETQPELMRRIDISKEAFDAVREGLFEVVNMPGGTAAVSGHSQYVQISGKTGTAQVRAFANMSEVKCNRLPVDFRHHGLFVGFAPREAPEIAIVAVAEHSCHGTEAAKVVKDVMDAFMKKQAQLAGRELEPLKVAPVVVAKKAKAADEEDDSVPAAPEDLPAAPPGLKTKAAATPATPAGSAEGVDETEMPEVE